MFDRRQFESPTRAKLEAKVRIYRKHCGDRLEVAPEPSSWLLKLSLPPISGKKPLVVRLVWMEIPLQFVYPK